MHKVPDFPVSATSMVIWGILLLLAVALFVQLLIHLNRKGHRRSIVAFFILLLMAGTAIHVVMLARSSHTVTDGNWIQLVLVSLMAALEMFIGHTVVFDDIIAAVIFGEPGLMVAYITIFVFIVCFTLSMVILIMPRRLRDRTWLRVNQYAARKNRKNHIFLGLDTHSKVFARTIMASWAATEDKTDEGKVILVDFPEAKDQHSEISIGELIANLFGHKKEISLEKELGSDNFTLLKGHMPDGEQKSLCKAIGLDRLSAWLENSRTTLYLLSQNEEENLHLLKLLATDPSIKAKVFCYSKRVNSYTSLMAKMGDRIRILNEPELSFMEIRQYQPQLHPIHFADIARNAAGEPLGYVKSPSTSMILGFGETGQEALRFLYEFGSFVGKDREPVPNSFKVYDASISTIKGDFLNRTPAFRYDANIDWSDATVGSSQFWLEFAMMLPALSYIVITVDHGVRNLEIAIQLLQEASRYGKDLSRLCILTCAHQADAQMLKLIDYYNRSYCPEGVSVIHPFGLPDKIWNLDVATGRSLKKFSNQFASLHRDATGRTESWQERSRRIRSRGGNELLNKQELMRKQAADIGMSLYAHTLRELCPERIRAAAADIPEEYTDTHFTGSPEDGTVLEYLAIGEHLHWMTALQAAGYIDGNGSQDELNKRILNLLPYQDIPGEEARHISWLSVKRSLLSQPEK